MDRTIKGNGGHIVPRKMAEVLKRNEGKAYISSDDGGQILADEYVDGKLYPREAILTCRSLRTLISHRVRKF
jgi:hypothetical protein